MTKSYDVHLSVNSSLSYRAISCSGLRRRSATKHGDHTEIVGIPQTVSGK